MKGFKVGDVVIVVGNENWLGAKGRITREYDYGPGSGGDDYEWGVRFPGDRYAVPFWSEEIRLASDVSLLEVLALQSARKKETP